MVWVFLCLDKLLQCLKVLKQYGQVSGECDEDGVVDCGIDDGVVDCGIDDGVVDCCVDDGVIDCGINDGIVDCGIDDGVVDCDIDDIGDGDVLKTNVFVEGYISLDFELVTICG